MCGIFAVVADKTGKAAQTVLEGLKKLEYRGYDSWGIAIIPNNSNILRVDKHVGKIGQAKTSLPNGNIAIGHTRWATHGGVTDRNAHPHLDCSQTIAVIHNGIIENHQLLKQELINKGHAFVSETDTEVIAHLIEEERKKKQLPKVVFSVFNKLVGSNAIAVLDLKSKTIVACRNGSPIAAGQGDEQYFLGSDVTPFLKYTQKVIFIADGEAIVMNRKGLSLFDLATQKKKKQVVQKLDWKLEDAQKSGYSHFLLKEIMEQKTTIPKTALINEKEILALARKIRSGDKVVIAACGTASYCGIATKYFFANLGIEVAAYGAYEFLPFAKFINAKTIFIAISQSGETADTLIATKAAKAKGAYIVGVVNARGSTLERLSNLVLPVGAGPEIAVVSTKAFTSQLLTLYKLAYASIGKYEDAKRRILQLGKRLDAWISKKLREKIIGFAKLLMDHEDIYIIGKYLNHPATMEFALKLKEASYIHAESFASGELKHGVITLIQKGTPCFVLASNDKTKHEVLSSAAELRARGGKIIGVAPFNAQEFDDLILTPDLGDLTLIVNIIVGQLLGYYLGVGRGTDPDKPRNLAKSVTVK